MPAGVVEGVHQVGDPGEGEGFIGRPGDGEVRRWGGRWTAGICWEWG